MEPVAQAQSIDEALAIVERSHADGAPISVGLLGNAAQVFPEIVARGIRPDVVTDQTAAHDPVNGYLPAGWSVTEWVARRESEPKAVEEAAKRSMATQVEAMLAFHRSGVPVVDYGNNLRQLAKDAGVGDAFDYPGFVQAYVRPLFCRGKGPFRWAALSGDPEDIYRTDEMVKELIPDDPLLHNWLDMARARIRFQGLPARICWLGLGQRHRVGLAFNRLVAEGAVSAPIVIGRDHMDSGSVASPNREAEGMRDGTDAVADWALLNALLNTASGATWVSIHHGGGVGIGDSQPPTRGHGRRRRRHRGRGAAAGAGAVERSRERGDAPCRRGLRRRPRLRPRARAEPSHDRARAMTHAPVLQRRSLIGGSVRGHSRNHCLDDGMVHQVLHALVRPRSGSGGRRGKRLGRQPGERRTPHRSRSHPRGILVR